MIRANSSRRLCRQTSRIWCFPSRVIVVFGGAVMVASFDCARTLCGARPKCDFFS